MHQVFDEQQVYRIDHYLGKETVQNLLVFRFANAIFEPVWNRNYVDSVQITAAEMVSVGDRAGYYDQAGIVRDMVQNHLLQLLTMVEAWRIVDPLLKGTEIPGTPPPHIYETGSWGPETSDGLLFQNGHSWQRVCGFHGGSDG